MAKRRKNVPALSRKSEPPKKRPITAEGRRLRAIEEFYNGKIGVEELELLRFSPEAIQFMVRAKKGKPFVPTKQG